MWYCHEVNLSSVTSLAPSADEGCCEPVPFRDASFDGMSPHSPPSSRSSDYLTRSQIHIVHHVMEHLLRRYVPSSPSVHLLTSKMCTDREPYRRPARFPNDRPCTLGRRGSPTRYGCISQCVTCLVNTSGLADKPTAAGLGLRSIFRGPTSPPPPTTSSPPLGPHPTSLGTRRTSGDRLRSPNEPQTFTTVRTTPLTALAVIRHHPHRSSRDGTTISRSE